MSSTTPPKNSPVKCSNEPLYELNKAPLLTLRPSLPRTKRRHGARAHTGEVTFASRQAYFGWPILRLIGPHRTALGSMAQYELLRGCAFGRPESKVKKCRDANANVIGREREGKCFPSEHAWLSCICEMCTCRQSLRTHTCIECL